LLDEVAETLKGHTEVVEAFSVTGDADAIARVRTRTTPTSSG
jgi:DNA-binding Lrp family transcriptional regulator